MILEKGMLLSVASGEWYIFISAQVTKDLVYLNCICDHANNVFSFEPDEIVDYLSLREISDIEWAGLPGRIRKIMQKRPIPHDVIVEALAGRHDRRFD